MSHVRQQIREQFATTVTDLSTTGSNVFQSRVYNLESTEINYNGEGEQPIAVMTMTYQVMYVTAEDSPGTAL